MKIKTYPGAMNPHELAIIMPAYNEEETIMNVVEEWHSVAKEHKGTLIVISDGSKDHTLHKLLESREKFPHLYIIQKQNSGHGPTCILGYKFAIAEKYQWIFQTDSDGQTSVEDFETFWKRRNQIDFQIGERLNRGDGLARKIISRVLRLGIYLTTKTKVPDSNVPFRLMRAEKLSPFLTKVPENFFLANALLSTVLVKYGSVQWFPITFFPRKGGIPSVSWKRFFNVGMNVLKDFWEIRESLNHPLQESPVARPSQSL